ncbi:hypothetical protein FE784_38660 [Paenibacillus hemerocallicola]|uniref:YgiT-type zinc finger protein n=1 Tax=Paenibacillus hemerocallicola TaxID=1172614 RepID=A0A5C4SY49_9BACL|nr:hypothetical protein [Paenibacillus hemerocallicola]TNJ57162.1 hypothetical protein FE784_38660 [Paenibacillus hemerocallicola]
MSFCCGASMIGTKGTLRHIGTHIHNVPLLFCPVCHRVEVHYRVESEYEILAEYAHGDGAAEVDFDDYVDHKSDAVLYDNCVNLDSEDPADVLHNQIDNALDLLAVAKQLMDEEWERQLKKRLTALNERRNKMNKKAFSAGNRKG